jgi:hypothetical protein
MVGKSSAVVSGNTGFASEYNNLRIDALALKLVDGGEKTIASGAVTVEPGKSPDSNAYFTIDTESDAASDDLATITATNGEIGDVIVISLANADRHVVIKHGTGNINTPDGYDMPLFDLGQYVILRYITGSAWEIIGGNYPRRRVVEFSMGTNRTFAAWAMAKKTWMQGWYIVADISGSCVVDLWVDLYSNGKPTDADSITNSNEPALSSAVIGQDLDIRADWSSYVFAADSLLVLNLDSQTTLNRIYFNLVYYQ